MSDDVYRDGPLCMLSRANEVEGCVEVRKGSDTSAVRERKEPHWGWPESVRRQISGSSSCNSIEISHRNAHPPLVPRSIANDICPLITDCNPYIYGGLVRQPRLTFAEHIYHSLGIRHFKNHTWVVLPIWLCRNARNARIPQPECFIWLKPIAI